MKTIHAMLAGAALCATAVSTLPAQTPVRVTADNVNLRAKPMLTAEVVAQARYNDQLVAREIGAEWVEVLAPAAVDLWVSKEFVQQPQNTIGTQRVNVRAGPSINYNVVATLSLGDPVEPRGEEIQEWMKIAPPPSAYLWISREFLEIPAGNAADAKKAEKSAENAEKSGKTAEISEKTAENGADEAAPTEKKAKKRKKKAEAEKPTADAAAAALGASLPTPIVSPSVPEKPDSAPREIPVPPPANLKLIPLEGQGRITEVEGELRAAPLINEAPTRYRVVRWQENRWQILCHVYGEATKFRSLQDQRVRMKGREYWIQGAAAPVLVPDQVQEIPAEGDPVGQ